MDPWESGDKFFEHAREHHKKMDEEFRRLCAEPCGKVPQKGDRVLIAAGLLGMGYPWVREEAVVMECGDTSYFVQFVHYKTYDEKTYSCWVNQNLITDVLAENQKEE